MVPGGLQAFTVDAEFADFVLFEHIEGDACEDGVVLSGATGTFAAEILAEADIDYPVQLVFNAPVLADGCVQPRCVGLEAGDVITDFLFCFPRRLVIALGFDPHQSL